MLNLNRDKDHFPVVKLFTPDPQATWLLTDLDSEFPDIAYGLCDLGMGFPELGDLYMPEIIASEENWAYQLSVTVILRPNTQ